tara:strand:+ start:2626 stop:3120 length:495 start_codon:yes stop_codon:yes gene_type:complete
VDRKYYISKEHLKELNNHKKRQFKKGNKFGFKIFNYSDRSSSLMSGGGKNSNTEILVEDPRKLTELTKNKSQGYRIYKPIISSSLNSAAGGLGARTGLYQTSKTDVRRLTPTECERLQGFPDGYTEGVSDTQRYKTLGNAVTVNVVTSLINKMFKGSEYDRTRK